MFDSSLFTAVYQVVGLPAALLLIYWIAMRWMKELAVKTAGDRKEHQNKWDSMLATWEKQAKRQEESYTCKTNQMFALYERQIAVSEMYAAQLSRLNEGIADIREKLTHHLQEMKKCGTKYSNTADSSPRQNVSAPSST